MPYNKLLRKIISNTNYTHEEISKKCSELGVNISRSYVTKLENTSKIPSEKISRAIAQVCNVDPRLLIIEGYLDKAPKEIKDAFISLKYIIMLTSLNIFENKIDKEIFDELKQILEKETLSEFVIELIDNGTTVLDTKEGYNLKSEDDKLIFKLSQPVGINITDNSMSPIIKEKDEVIMEIKDKYEDSDILVVKFNNEEHITTRQAIILGNNIKLVPLQNEYKSKLVHIGNEDIKILGKVKKIIRKL